MRCRWRDPRLPLRGPRAALVALDNPTFGLPPGSRLASHEDLSAIRARISGNEHLAVFNELRAAASPLEVRTWLSAHSSWLDVQPVKGQVDPGLAYLGAGESDAIALALELHADAILMDDREGRMEACKRNLNVIGGPTEGQVGSRIPSRCRVSISSQSALDLHQGLASRPGRSPQVASLARESGDESFQVLSSACFATLAPDFPEISGKAVTSGRKPPRYTWRLAAGPDAWAVLVLASSGYDGERLTRVHLGKGE